MPFALIPFLLLIVPVVEIAAFIIIGGQIGVLPTLAMILVTAIIGTFLLRSQGFAVLARIKQESQAGGLPGRALGDGAMILVAGVLLLTPGFVTDAIGFSLFVPFVRDAIWSFLAKRITIVTPMGPVSGERSPRYDDHDATIIDLEEDAYSRGKASDDSPWRKDDKPKHKPGDER